MNPMGIAGAWIYTPRIYSDNRGDFHEWYRGAEFTDDLGYRLDLAQANCSVSHRGVIRGIHFTEVPPGQAKYIVCTSGAILDVVVDIRVGSPTFARWEAVRLDDQTRRAMFISEGLGHAFMAVSPMATVVYLCSTPFAPGIEHGVHPLDQQIGITWPADVQAVMSGKDAGAPSLAEAQQAGLLPAYRDCLDFAVSRAASQPPQPAPPPRPSPPPAAAGSPS
jgi:dTDP-4-dehydrorhamnose 3,5-epimerase